MMSFEAVSPFDTRLALPPPQMTGGLPLMDTLAIRQSTRHFGTREISPQLLSNLLWAADGVNRGGAGGRTAPSARDWQEIDIYIARADGVFLYLPEPHTLQHVLAHDVRALTGAQDFVATAPVNLVYVADLSKVDAVDAAERRFYCAADAGFIAQNVYLFCASAGLATVVRGLLNRRELAKAMGLHSHQRILLAQTVGYATAQF